MYDSTNMTGLMNAEIRKLNEEKKEALEYEVYCWISMARQQMWPISGRGNTLQECSLWSKSVIISTDQNWSISPADIHKISMLSLELISLPTEKKKTVISLFVSTSDKK